MLIIPKLHENTEVPYYIQLYHYFKNEIIGGVLAPNIRLPSIRSLASQLGISSTPVELAYQQLLSEGFITSRPKSGYYVLPIHLSYGKAVSMKRPGPSSFPITARDAQHYPYDFHISKNDFSVFPHKIWRSLYQEQLANEELLQYGDPQGEPGLRASISAYLNSFRGLQCSQEQVVIGGDQYTLASQLSLMLQNSTGRLGFEDPGYHLVPSTFARNGYEALPIDLQEDGLNLITLYQSNANIVYVSPSHQFPMGMTMPIGKRLALLEWAKVRQGYIIEDDYDGEFRYHGRPIPSLQGLVANSPVIYMGSFAQSLSPALCIHYMILPKELLPLYHCLKSELYLEHSASRLNQIALHYFIERGHFGRHLRKMRQLYQRKHDVLLQSLKKYFGECGIVLGRDAGFHLLLRISHDHTKEQLVSLAKKAGVRITPMSYTWWDKRTSGELEFIMGFGGIAEDRIAEGIRTLKNVWYP
ncbi:transcriptional regulator [Bacillus sp. FJAT-27264]|uniref:MocR-like pyridoxine biosynthesis transcription factor PdxR n=1 Tax=Paenibacillus sp. (strain DSM 101736 / FJAT-27264) TaxID=1850362 RepID=UPI000807FE86|nr:PLP-dependent aminotransferase family protein [Bacillus sp. FJAT-27264]OBZ10674.1 transcriptional regulator [Bacillus sp. FJAT-27264]